MSAGKLTAAAVMAALTLPPRAAMACSAADIEIRRAEVIVGSRTTYVVGEVANGCVDQTGVQIRITLRNDGGDVVLTGEFWPAGGRNIPAGDRRGFTYVVSPADGNPGRRATSIGVEVSGVRTW